MFKRPQGAQRTSITDSVSGKTPLRRGFSLPRGLRNVINMNMLQSTRFFKKKAELEKELFGILADLLLGEKLPFDLTHGETGEILIPAHRKISKYLLRKIASCYSDIEMEPGPLRNKLREIFGNFEPRFRELEAAFYPPGMDLTVNEWL